MTKTATEAAKGTKVYPPFQGNPTNSPVNTPMAKYKLNNKTKEIKYIMGPVKAISFVETHIDKSVPEEPSTDNTEKGVKKEVVYKEKQGDFNLIPKTHPEDTEKGNTREIYPVDTEKVVKKEGVPNEKQWDFDLTPKIHPVIEGAIGGEKGEGKDSISAAIDKEVTEDSQ